MKKKPLEETKQMSLNAPQLENLLNSIGITERNYHQKVIPSRIFEKLSALLDKAGCEPGHLINLYNHDEIEDVWEPSNEVYFLDSFEEFMSSILG